MATAAGWRTSPEPGAAGQDEDLAAVEDGANPVDALHDLGLTDCSSMA
jgi:hypothetical protein